MKIHILVNLGQFAENFPKQHVNLAFTECENAKDNKYLQRTKRAKKTPNFRYLEILPFQPSTVHSLIIIITNNNWSICASALFFSALSFISFYLFLSS